MAISRLQQSRKIIVFLCFVFLVASAVPIYLTLRKPSSKTAAAWYGSTWKYRKRLVIDRTKVSGGADLTSFPVLVNQSDEDYRKAQSTGNDFLFTSADGTTKLDHEIEKFDQVAGKLVAWVRIPTLSASVDTVIYLYYGNPSAASQQNKTGVWDENYIGVWHLSETAGNQLNSTSTSNINITSGTSTQQGTATGIADGADEFGGATNYKGVNDNAALRQDGDMTIETWIKMDAQGGRPVFKGAGANPWRSYEIWLKGDADSNRAQFNWYNSSGASFDRTSISSLQTGIWYHVVGVKSGSSVLIYLNGVNDSGAYNPTVSGSVFATDPSKFVIGNTEALNSPFDGIQDETRYSNIARSAGWIATTYNTVNSPSTFFSGTGAEETGGHPISWWTFDDATGTVAQDIQPANNDGSVSGAAWKAKADCVHESCLYFDGSDDVVTVANANSIDMDISLGKQLTYQAWVRVNSDGEGSVGQIFSKGTNTYLRTTNDDGGAADLEASLDLGTADATATVTNGLTLNRWHHVAMGYTDDNDDELSVYIDGQLKSTSANGEGAPVSDSNNLLIGGSSGANFHGFIDDFVVYDVERSAADITIDFTGGAAVLGIQDTKNLSDGLAGYWKMDETSGNAADSSGTGVSLTNNASTAYSAGKYGNAASLTAASSQYLSGNSINSTSASVSTSTVSTTTAYPFQRKTWYDGTRYWQALNANSRIEFWYSDSGSSWTENTSARIAVDSNDFSILANGSALYIAYFTSGVTSDIYSNSASSYPSINFSWNTATRVFDGSIGMYENFPYLSIDTNGYLWLSTVQMEPFVGAYTLNIKRSGSANSVTSWDGASELDSCTDCIMNNPGVTVPLLSGNVYIVWISGTTLFGKKYNGTSWDSSATTIASDADSMATYYISAVSDNNGYIHLLYLDTSGYIKYKRYTTSWQTAVTLDGNAGNSSPVITIDTANANTLYALWIRGNTIYYKKGVSDYTSGNWDTNPTTFYSTGTNTYLTSAYSDQGSGRNFFLGWTNGAGSPYTVKWGSLSAVSQTVSGVKSLSLWLNPTAITDEIINLMSSTRLTMSSGAVSATGFSAPTVYVNGVQDGTVTAGAWNHLVVSSDTAINADAFEIGRANGAYYNGKIDEVRLYNRTLSSNEVRELYNFAPGPVAYWKLDEGSGQYAYDSSGNGSSAYVGWSDSVDSDEPVRINGKFGNAFKFDGENDTLQTISTTNLDTDDNMTIEMWIYPTGGSGVLYARQSGGNIIEFSFDLATYSIYLWNEDVGSVFSNSNVITPNAWNHVVASVSTDVATYYVNGVVQGGGSYDIEPIGSATPASIGSFATFSEFFPGYIDEVKLYNYARTPAQIIEDMNAGHPAPGSPVGSAISHWDFDEGYGTTANDSESGDNDLTLNTASWTNSGKFGKPWNGTGGNVRLSKTTDADLEFGATEDFTFTTWFKSDSANNPAATEYIMADGGPADSAGYALYATTDGYICVGIDDDTSWGPDVSSCTATDFYDNTWHQITAVRNVTADTLTLYIDSTQKDSDTDTTSATLDSSPTFSIVVSPYTADPDFPLHQDVLDKPTVKLFPFPILL